MSRKHTLRKNKGKRIVCVYNHPLLSLYDPRKHALMFSGMVSSTNKAILQSGREAKVGFYYNDTSSTEC